MAALEGFILAVASSPVPGALFKEDGALEWIQFSFVAASGAILLANARLSLRYGALFRVLGLLAFVAGVRELDDFFEYLAFDGAYKAVNGGILALCVYLVWRQRRQLVQELTEFSRTPPFHLILWGSLVVVAYAQLLGQKELWDAIMGESHLRIVKRSVEEILETVGYALILIGSVETLFLRAREQDPPRSADPTG